MEPQDQQELVPPTSIRYIGLGQLKVYLVSEDELRLIEGGGPTSTYLNLAIAFLSIGASLVASLLLSEPKSIYRFVVVVVIIVGTLIAGVILLLLWRRSAKDATNAIQRIRARGIPSSTGTVIEATIEDRLGNS